MESGSSGVIGGGLMNNSKSQLETSRNDPQFIIKTDKKTTVVFNYTRLAEILKANPEISEKIKSGTYGNSPVKKGETKLGKFIQQSVKNEITKDMITSIINDFNST